MKGIVSTTTAIGTKSLGASYVSVTDISCKNCDTLNIEATNYLFPFNLGTTAYCAGCGINLNSQRYDLDCDVSCGISDEFTEVGQECCQVPFPNRELIAESNKPNLEILKLKF